MSESTWHMGGAGPGAPDPADGADYRIREVEARLDRRLVAIEGRQAYARWVVRLAGAGLAIAVVALAVVLWTVTSDDGVWAVDTLAAREVVLRDGNGIERGRWAADAEGRAQLSLSDPEGRTRIRLTVLADGSPGVTISDPDARPRAVLGYLPDGTTSLVLADAEGTGRAVLGLEADGATQALFTDRDGSIRTLVGVGADGAPSVSTFEETSPSTASTTNAPNATSP